MFHKPYFSLRYLLLMFILPLMAGVMPSCAAQNGTLQSQHSKSIALQINAQSNVSIVLPAETIPSEETAAKEILAFRARFERTLWLLSARLRTLF